MPNKKYVPKNDAYENALNDVTMATSYWVADQYRPLIKKSPMLDSGWESNDEVSPPPTIPVKNPDEVKKAKSCIKPVWPKDGANSYRSSNKTTKAISRPLWQVLLKSDHIKMYVYDFNRFQLSIKGKGEEFLVIWFLNNQQDAVMLNGEIIKVTDGNYKVLQFQMATWLLSSGLGILLDFGYGIIKDIHSTLEAMQNSKLASIDRKAIKSEIDEELDLKFPNGWVRKTQ